MQHSLLIYDHKTQQLREQRQFPDNESEAATAAYQDAENEYQDEHDIEIVLIGSDSMSTIARTHGHYFGDNDRLAKYMTSA